MILPYISVLGCGVATSIGVGKKTGKNGKFNYPASIGVAACSLISSSVSNTIIDTNYEHLMEREKAQTTTAYIQQLSDDELGAALIKFDLLEEDNKTNVKVL